MAFMERIRALCVPNPGNGDDCEKAVRIAVGIATIGRPQMLRAVLDELTRQSRRADRIVVCAPSDDDVEGVPADAATELVLGVRGLTRQRNAILARLDGFDAAVFFDDDFLPSPAYLAVVERVFAEHPDICMVTGRLIADGIIGPGFSLAEAQRWLAESAAPAAGPADELEPVANGYGCNMAIRLAAVRAASGCFDERLPLYGWLEDLDFSRQLARHGRIVKAAAAQGVHLGIKHGRQSGIRLGYSQIANPIYLSWKGTCSWRRAIRLMSRNVAANLVRSLHPEPYIDRAGRTIGNIKAVKDLVMGRLDPERIMEL